MKIVNRRHKLTCKEINEFSVNVGLDQLLVLGHYVFTLVLSEVTKENQKNVPWCVMLADDIVLIDTSKQK